MKLVALVLLLVVSAHAQTLKWTVPVPPPPVGADIEGGDVIHSDPAGNAVLSFRYSVASVPGYCVLWVSATGKQLHAEAIANVNDITLLYVSGSDLVVFCEPPSGEGAPFLRKFKRRNGSVTFVDTEMPLRSNSPGRIGSSEVGRGCFLVVERDMDGNPTAIRRYNR